MGRSNQTKTCTRETEGVDVDESVHEHVSGDEQAAQSPGERLRGSTAPHDLAAQDREEQPAPMTIPRGATASRPPLRVRMGRLFQRTATWIGLGRRMAQAQPVAGGAPPTALDDADEDVDSRCADHHDADGDSTDGTPSRARLSRNTPATTGDGVAPGPLVANSAADGDRPDEGSLPSPLRAGRAETTRPECDPAPGAGSAAATANDGRALQARGDGRIEEDTTAAAGATEGRGDAGRRAASLPRGLRAGRQSAQTKTRPCLRPRGPRTPPTDPTTMALWRTLTVTNVLLPTLWTTRRLRSRLRSSNSWTDGPGSNGVPNGSKR